MNWVRDLSVAPTPDIPAGAVLAQPISSPGPIAPPGPILIAPPPTGRYLKPPKALGLCKEREGKGKVRGTEVTQGTSKKYSERFGTKQR